MHGLRVLCRGFAESQGGAVVTDTSNFTISQSVFDLNRAQSQGGAIFQSNSTGNAHSSVDMRLYHIYR